MFNPDFLFPARSLLYRPGVMAGTSGSYEESYSLSSAIFSLSLFLSNSSTAHNALHGDMGGNGSKEDSGQEQCVLWQRRQVEQ